SGRGLSRIAPLHSFVALLTMADVDIEASPDGLAHDFLLILRLGPIEDHTPPAATPPRQGNGNDFVHLLAREFALSSTISRTRLAPRRFLVVPVPAPIASLAAARLHFLCVAVHSLGGQHATAAEAARSCVSTRAESPRTSDPISGNLRKIEQLRQRSEEHTSELQSHLNLVCRLLLEKKKIINNCSLK